MYIVGKNNCKPTCNTILLALTAWYLCHMLDQLESSQAAIVSVGMASSYRRMSDYQQISSIHFVASHCLGAPNLCDNLRLTSKLEDDISLFH